MAAIFNTNPPISYTFPSNSPLSNSMANPTLAPAPKLSESRTRVFQSIFPQSEAKTLPTPLATPSSSFINPGVAAASDSIGELIETGEEFHRKERYWHMVTSLLSFPAPLLERGEKFRATGEKPRKLAEEYLMKKEEEGTQRGENVEAAIMWLARWDEEFNRVHGENLGKSYSFSSPPAGNSLSEWYTHEVRRHFLGHVRERALVILEEAGERVEKESDEQCLKRILWEIRSAWEVYIGVYKRWILLMPLKIARVQRSQMQTPRQDHENGDNEHEEGLHLFRFVKGLNSLISYILPDPAWSQLVYRVFVEWCEIILMNPSPANDREGDKQSGNEMEVDSISGVVSGKPLSSLAATTTKTGQGVLDEETDEEDDDATQKDTSQYVGFNSQVTDHEGDISLINPHGQLSPPLPERRHTRQSSPAFSDSTSDHLRLQKEARKKLLSAWEDMQILNLGGSGRRGERVFAEVVNVLITKYIETIYAGEWAAEDGKNIPKEISDWIEYKVGGLVRLVLLGGKKYIRSKAGTRLARIMKEGKKRVLSPRASFRANHFGQGVGVPRTGIRISIDGVILGDYKNDAMDVESEREKDDELDDVGDVLRAEDIEGWKRMAMGRLGRLRVGELFEIVVDWPDSFGGVMDLRAYITTPQTRLHLTTTFTNAIATRILHPAASTTDILRVYISLIRAFTVLDPRGVLLDRVTRGIRRYLREREDTVKVIVRGLMGGNTSKAKSDDLEAANKVDEDDLRDLVDELLKGSKPASDYSASAGVTAGTTVPAGSTDEIDYDDMNWVPDPIDAGPEYRKSKGTDVVGSLLSLYDSKEIFVREFQNILAERLLENRGEDGDYEMEITTLELLRIRFGEALLQACDVMVKDIHDSKRMDSNIRSDQKLDVYRPTRKQSPTNPNRVVDEYSLEKPPELHAKILSKLFWPNNMKDEEDFKVPGVIREFQDRYEVGFEKLNQKRKLNWLDNLGDVHVELEMEDRIVVVEDAKTWQVSVIYAFDNTDNAGGEGVERVKKTVAQLKEELDMDEGLVRKAVGYWIVKGVLREIGKDCFVVVERMEDFEEEVEDEEEQQVEECREEGNADTRHTISASATLKTKKRIRYSSTGGQNNISQLRKNSPLDGTVDENKKRDRKSTSTTKAQSQTGIATNTTTATTTFPFPPHFRLYERYVTAMLTNNGPMTVGKIVKMMEMVVPSADTGGVGGGYTEGIEGMRRLLEWLKQEGTVFGGEDGDDENENEGEKDGGQWRMVRSVR